MGPIIDFLAFPFTLIMSWPLWQRAAVVFAVLLTLLFLVGKSVGKIMRAILGGTVWLLYWLICEKLFALTQNKDSFSDVRRRNRLAEQCERLYDRLCPPKEKRKKLHIGRFFIVYIIALLLVSLPSMLWKYLPDSSIPSLSLATNLYHMVEMPLLRQAQRTEPLIPANASAFMDVGVQYPYLDSIQFVCSCGLLESKDDHFYPEDALTRLDLAIMLYHYAGEPRTDYQAGISDMQTDLEAYQAIHWCVKKGILTLIENEAFMPEQLVTREQFLVALYRYVRAEDLPTERVFDLSILPSSEEINDWAVDAYKWAAQNDLLIWDSNDVLSPQAFISRGSASEVFYQFSLWERDLVQN